ncbi:hypothetical protein [Vibrio sonorensis]|uniref:capsular polysaccharide export protein, LipB/KpsS family n=1 Tax=Vibrio sonorensis TaxID=1004316 RepID=UPI001FE02052|nr:hypothetical protein [Vibrio sonorensis]
MSIEEIKSGKTIQYGLHLAHSNDELKRATLWVFSGFQFSAMELAQLYNSTRYFEIANFPNKYQSSYKGVNADADHDKKVRSLSSSHTITQEDMSGLVNLLNHYRPPHVDTSILSKSVEQVINLLGFYVLNTAAPQASPLAQIKTAFEIQKCRKLIERFQATPLPERYSLFIGQVSQDSQTVLQSKVNTKQALINALNDIDKPHSHLVLRLHPGEKKLSAITELIEFSKEHNIIVSNKGSLFEVAAHCEKVYTINSTGGLQCLLLDKEVTTYGDAFYKGWDKKLVTAYYKYVLRELVSE